MVRRNPTETVEDGSVLISNTSELVPFSSYLNDSWLPLGSQHVKYAGLLMLPWGRICAAMTGVAEIPQFGQQGDDKPGKHQSYA